MPSSFHLSLDIFIISCPCLQKSSTHLPRWPFSYRAHVPILHRCLPFFSGGEAGPVRVCSLYYVPALYNRCHPGLRMKSMNTHFSSQTFTILDTLPVLTKKQFHAAIFFASLRAERGQILGGKAHDETQKGLYERTGCLTCSIATKTSPGPLGHQRKPLGQLF